MSNRNIWSDFGRGRVNAERDLVLNLDRGVGSLTTVDKQIGKAGELITTFDCGHCGWQCRAITVLPEMLAFYRGMKVKDTVALRDGIVLKFGCGRCQHRNDVMLSWSEIRDYIEDAVRAGRIPPQR